MFLNQGISVKIGEKPLETVGTDYSTVELMATGGGTELVRWSLKKGGRLGLAPDEGQVAIEFLYIVDGKLRGEIGDQEVRLGTGQVLTAGELHEPIIFHALEDTLIIYVTTQPTFHFLSDQVQDLMKLAVEVEEQDEYTAGHCRRIRDLSIQVGEYLGLSTEAMHRLTFGAFLHDVGKCRIPKEFLNKPGPLTAEEWTLMKKHPTFGREMLDQTCIQEAGIVIEQHHERLDGSGYPLGLKGDEILIEAQIVAVVDSYDAMTTDRPYRKRMSHEWALSELRKGAGTAYSSEVVEAFYEVMRSKQIEEAIQ